jgi:hypothetical protein
MNPQEIQVAAKEKRVSVPEEFVEGNLEGMEAVIIRIGAGDAQLVLVDGAGRWDRWVYHSVEACTAKAEELGITEIHVGEYPEKTRVRINSYQRTEASYAKGAYPEQGEVGPVKPYPENRPRPAEPLAEEEAEREKNP